MLETFHCWRTQFPGSHDIAFTFDPVYDILFTCNTAIKLFIACAIVGACRQEFAPSIRQHPTKGEQGTIERARRGERQAETRAGSGAGRNGAALAVAKATSRRSDATWIFFFFPARRVLYDRL